MLAAHETAKSVLERTGRNSAWVARRMDELNPTLQMTPGKLNQALLGKRKLTADELIAFCMATDTQPNSFIADESA